MSTFCFLETKSVIEVDFGVNGFLGYISTVLLLTKKKLKKFSNKSQNGVGEFVHQKKRFYTQKHQKKSMSKNGIQNRVAFLYREL